MFCEARANLPTFALFARCCLSNRVRFLLFFTLCCFFFTRCPRIRIRFRFIFLPQSSNSLALFIAALLLTSSNLMTTTTCFFHAPEAIFTIRPHYYHWCGVGAEFGWASARGGKQFVCGCEWLKIWNFSRFVRLPCCSSLDWRNSYSYSY